MLNNYNPSIIPTHTNFDFNFRVDSTLLSNDLDMAGPLLGAKVGFDALGALAIR